MKIKWYDALFKVVLLCVIATVFASFISDYPVDLGIASGMISFVLWQYWNFAHCKPSVFHGIE